MVLAPSVIAGVALLIATSMPTNERLPTEDSPSNNPAQPPPPPPWSFQVSRIQYQFRSVPVALAQQTVPTDDLVLLSAGGMTLGGLFAVEYEETPVGPYREVAILSALVAERKNFLSIGAWASHIFVDSEQAAMYGQKYWGLPATACPIVFSPLSGEQLEQSNKSPGAKWNFSKDRIKVLGWDSNNPTSESEQSDAFSLSRVINMDLPSFSGCLPINEIDSYEEITKTPLLRYPLSIIEPQAFATSVPGTVSCEGITDDELLRNMLEQGRELLSFDIRNVQLKAGEATVISSQR